MPSFLHRLRDQQVDADNVGLEDVQIDVRLSAPGVQPFPVVTRYAWPAELDLRARLAGLRLHQHWGGWQPPRPCG